MAVAGSGRASLVTYVNPAVAVLLGVAFLNESLRPATVVGFAFILAGCWLSTRTVAAAGIVTSPRPKMHAAATDNVRTAVRNIIARGYH